MSQENVVIVRRANALANAGERESVLALLDPQAEWCDLAHAPDTREVVRGIDAIRSIWQQWTIAFDEFGADVYEYIDVHPWVVCDVRWHGKGQGSGLNIDLRQADAYELQNGKIVRVVLAYPDVAAAIKAVGLAESAMSEQSTTPDLVELVGRLLDAADRRDFDAIMRSFAPDAVWEAVSLGTSFEGVAAIRGFLKDWLGAYDEYEIEPEEMLDLGNGVVFVVTRLAGRPVGSSTDSTLTRRRPLVFTWVQGLVAQVTAPSSDTTQARAAAERLAESRG